MKKVKMTDEQMEAMAPGEYTTWEKRVWRRGYEAALSQQPAAVDEAAAIRAFEEHLNASADDPYFEGELELWLAAWRAALAQQPEAQCGEELPSPLNGDFDCPKAAAARSCPCGFCRALRTPSAPVKVEGFDEWFDEYTKNNYTDEMLALAAWKQALAQPPACKSRIEQVAQEVLAEYENDEAFDFLKAVVGKIVARVAE